MARFGFNDADNYGGNGGGGFFSLKNDHDVARVRFMYNNIDDVVGYAVHEVSVGDKKRYVNCLRAYGDPISKCPFCEAKRFQNAKLFVPVYDVESGQIKIWERGKKFFAKLSSLCSRYASSDRPLVAREFEIERNGKAGDTATTYEIYPLGDSDGTRISDLPEVPEILGGLVLDKTYDEMAYYINHNRFPDNNAPQSRESYGRDSYRDEAPVRRTPSTHEDTF